MELALELAEVCGRAAGVLLDRAGRVAEHLLTEEAEARAPGVGDRTAVWLVEPGRDPQQGRLAGAVRTDEADPVALCHAERHVVQELAVAEPAAHGLDREGAHAFMMRSARWQCGQWNVPRPPTTVRTMTRPQRGHCSPARPYTLNSC